MNNEDFEAQVEAYVTGGLSSDERMNFEQALATNPQLQEEVELYQDTVNMLRIESRAMLKRRVRGLHEEMGQQNSGKQVTWQVGRVAAVIIIMLIPTYFFMQGRYSDSALYSDYYEVPTVLVNRGSGSTLLSEGKAAFEEERFDEAIASLGQLSTEAGQVHDEALYWLGHAYLGQGNYALAVDAFEGIQGKAVPGASTRRVQWYLALAYLANKETKKAKDLLDALAQEPDDLGEEAKDLSGDMESFWR